MKLGNVIVFDRVVYKFDNQTDEQSVTLSHFIDETFSYLKRSGRKIDVLNIEYTVLLEPSWFPPDQREHKLDFVNGEKTADLDKLEFYLNALKDEDYTVREKIFLTMVLCLDYDFNDETFSDMINDGIDHWDSLEYLPSLYDDDGIAEIKYTSYANAIDWFNNQMIQCNNIGTDFELEYYDIMPSEFNESEIDIYQYYLTDWDYSDVEFIRKHFPDVIIGWSEKLELYVLCVDHCGTSWRYVETTVYTEDLEDYQIERLKKDVDPEMWKSWNKED
jgi:hypothetical protein